MADIPEFPQLPDLPDMQETAWIEVIRKMEEVYSDLIRYEIDLEQKNQALEEAQQFITSVVSSVSDVLLVCDERDRVQQVNKALTELTGFTEAEVIGRPVRDVFVADPALPARFTEMRDCELRLTAKDGATDPVAVNCSTRYDHRGRPAGIVLIGRPVGELRRAYEALNTAHAELKQAQQQLIQAEKMASLGRLVAGVAHELNNPISFVYGNVHTLQKYRERLAAYLTAIHGGADETEREALRKSLRIDRLMADLPPLIEGTLEGAVRVSDIVKNLRRLSFSNTGEPERLDIAAVTRNAVHWAVKGSRKTAALDLRLPDGLMVRGHAGQLHQVVVNLVENALDAVAEAAKPAISVEADCRGENVRIVLRDNGPGIEDCDLLKVFDPFFTTKPVGQGTGLGLWISYGIIRDHGGAIEIANAPGGGAMVTITLPGA